MANWMAGAVPESRKGVFKAKAERAGETTAQFAKEKEHAPGKLGAEARLAETFAKERPRKDNIASGYKKK